MYVYCNVLCLKMVLKKIYSTDMYTVKSLGQQDAFFFLCLAFKCLGAILWSFWVDFRGVPFQGTTVGLAPVMSMCSDFQSGGVNMVSYC